MSKNTANPSGPQYGSGRRDESPSGVTLPTDFLGNAWNRELESLERKQSVSEIQRQVARATGFAWGLRAADLVNEDTHKAMEEGISNAEQAARDRLERGNDERD